MKRNLLKYINVKEFAAEAEFLDPGPSFILPNVACRYYLTKQICSVFVIQICIVVPSTSS